MSFVVDEYGGCIGLVTIEDLLERIVGEIEDEYDKPEKLYEPYAEGGFLVEGNTETSGLLVCVWYIEHRARWSWPPNGANKSKILRSPLNGWRTS